MNSEEESYYDTIYHLSDIHIRLYARIKEYRHVFERVYDFIRRDRVGKRPMIVITGDILHNKIELTPECILLTLEFLRTLSESAIVILIAGNHDALLNNRDRMDSITSILQDRCPPNVHYLRYTGYYRFKNIIFGVNSVLDDIPLSSFSEDTMTMNAHEPIDEKTYRIGLFHGQMSGWINSFGFQHEHGETTVEEWKGFDFVLLGDIHQYQYMNSNKTIAYAGSLISQNFGETNREHGILVWNLTDGTSFYHSIENPYAFRTFEMMTVSPQPSFRMESREYTWEQIQEELPEFGNVKLKIPCSKTTTEHQEWIYHIKQRFPNMKIQVESMLNRWTEQNTSLEETMMTAITMEHESEWIQHYMVQRLRDQLDSEALNEMIHELYSQYKLYLESQRRNHPSWELVSISFSHLFGYGTQNQLCLTELHPHSVTGIFGKNSAGKSTLIDIIVFMLYGKITRGSGNTIPKEIIHFKEKESIGELCFKVGSQLYKMEKKMVRVRGKQDKIKITETLFLYENEKEQWTNISQEHRKKTDKIVEQLLGTMESFLFTNFALQQQNKSFREMTQKERKEFLYQILCLDWFDNYKKQCEEEWKQMKTEEKTYQDLLQQGSLRHYQSEMESLRTALTATSTQLEDIHSEWTRIESDYNQYMMHHIEKESYQNMELEIGESQQEIRQIEQQRQVTQSKLDSLCSQTQSVSDLQVQMERYRHIQRLETELYQWEIPDFIQRQYWMVQSYDQWFRYYQSIQKTMADSESILRRWNQTQSRKETLLPQLQSMSVSFPASFTPLTTTEKEAFETKQKIHEREMEQLESKLSELDSVLTISHTEELEHPSWDTTILPELQREYHQYQSIMCQWNAFRETYKDTFDISYNPECVQCMQNPFYIQKNHYQCKMNMLEESVSNSRTKLIQLLDSESLSWYCRRYEDASSSSLPTIEERVEGVIRYAENAKKHRFMYTKTSESIRHKKDTFRGYKQRWEDTLRYEEYQQLQTEYKKLQQELTNGVLSKQYQLLTQSIPYISFYERLHQYRKLKKEMVQTNLNHAIQQTQLKLDEIEQFQSIRSQLESELLESEHALHQKRFQLKELIKTQEKYKTQLLEQGRMEEYRRQMEACQKKKESILSEQFRLQNEWNMMEYKKTEYQKMSHILTTLRETKRRKELLISSIDRDGLPFYLLNRYVPSMENELQTLCQSFLSPSKKMVFHISEKEVVVGLQTNEQISNYLGGMESFIMDLSLKFIFSKYAQIPRSNFFMIDEGISVFDQDTLSNVQVLFNFLTSIVDHVLLISHLPTIQDFVDQSIFIRKRDDYSQLELYL